MEHSNNVQIELPENFDLESSDEYILTILLEEDSLSYVLYHPDVQTSFFYKKLMFNKKISVEANIKEIFFDGEIFMLPYKKLWVLTNTESFTFIPSFIFSKKENDPFLNFNFENSSEKILNTQLKNPEITVVYNMDMGIYEFLHRSLINPVFVHSICPLIFYFQERIKLTNANNLIIHLRKHSFDALCFSHGKFIFANHFHFNDINDLVYYIFFIWKQLKLSQLKDIANIVGDAGHKERLLKIMKTYLRNIIPVNVPSLNHLKGINTGQIPFDMLSLSLYGL